MSRKYYLKEKYHRKLSYFLLCQMKIMIAVSLAVVGMNGLLTNVHAQNEVYGIYQNDEKVYVCDEHGNPEASEIDIKDVTYLYIAADVRVIYDAKKLSTDKPRVHTVEFLETQVLETIESNAFENFVNLVGILNLSNHVNLKRIGSTAFRNTKLTSIKLPKDIFDIAADAFSGCGTLENIEVNNQGAKYYSKDGVLFKSLPETNEKTLFKYPEGRNNSNYIVPDEVEVINGDAFGNSKVEKILFGSGSQLIRIQSKAFENACLISIQLPASVNNIHTIAFNECNKLESILVDGANTTYCSKDGILFQKGTGNNIDTLYRYPEGKTGTTYTIPDGVETIASYVFYNVKKLKKVTIPASVMRINDRAFQNSNIEKVLFKDNSQLKNIEHFAFSDSSLSEIDLPEGLEKISNRAFNNTQLSTINIPQSVTNIEGSPFSNCPNMTAINVAENNQNYQSVEGDLYTKNGEKLLSYPTAKSINTYQVKDGVNTVGYGAFSYSKNTPYVVIPSSVDQIEGYAFSDSLIKGILFEGALPTFGSNVFLDANANLKLYTLNSNDASMNQSLDKEILLYKAPTLTLEDNHEGKPGDTYQIEPIVNDDATFKNDMSYTYTSSNPAIASVTPAGLITMHKSGTANIKVTATDLFTQAEAIITVNVKEEVIDEGNQETPPTDPDSVVTPSQPGTNNNTPNQPEIKPQENQKEPESSNQVKTSDETMIIGMIGMLLLGGMGILSLRRKES